MARPRKDTRDQRGQPTREQMMAERRQQRTDIGNTRDRLRTPKIDGYVTRWVNDELRSGRNRVAVLQDLGWQICDIPGLKFADPSVIEGNKDLGTGYRVVAGQTEQGKPYHSILMMIPEDIYEMDQQLKEEAILEKEESIRRKADEPGMYGNMGG